MARVIAWRQFNEVHPHDALGGKTPAEVYRDSERRSLEPLVPSYPPEWKTRLVSKVGTISVNDDVVFVSTSLAGQIVGLKQEGLLRWRAHFFGVDLGTIEIAPLANVLTPDDVSSVTLVNAPHSEAVNASVTQGALLNARPPFDVSEIQQLVWEFAERRQASAVQTKWNRPTVPGSRMSLPCSTGKSGAPSRRLAIWRVTTQLPKQRQLPHPRGCTPVRRPSDVRGVPATR